MAKKSSTLHLEESDWEKINEYQRANNISSRNDAVARILLEWEMLNKIINSKEPLKVQPEKEVEQPKISDDVGNAMSDIFGKMK